MSNTQRAAVLADPVFFSQRSVCEKWIIAELRPDIDTVHGVLFDTETNAMYCTCPFQPKPCVHAQALALLYAREDAPVFEPVDELPAWAHALVSGQPARMTNPRASEAQREANRDRRRFERLERAGRGFEDLEIWLLDTLRRGLATSISEEPAFYQTIAARLADASMRGLSRNLRLLETIPTAASDWADRTLAVLADAALALHAFRARDRMPDALLHDLEAFIGIPQKKETVLDQGETLRDAWAVAGAVEEVLEAHLRVRRTWLLGARSGRFALLLDFAFGDLAFPPGFGPGAVLEGDLTFYPSIWPQRALVPSPLQTLPKRVENLPGFADLEALAGAYAAALGAQPWLTHFPVVLNEVVPYQQNSRFGLADVAGKSLPLATDPSASWSLVALAGGHPVTVFGEWDGERFRVLSVAEEGRLVVY